MNFPHVDRNPSGANSARLLGVVAIVALLGGACTTERSSIAEATSNARGSSVSQTSGELDWGSCAEAGAEGAGLECATLEVPIDYENPEAGSLELELARKTSTGTGSERIGSLLFNPGGPGGSGIEFLGSAAFTVPADIQDHFDLVSWDPRGVGESSPVECLDSSEKDAQISGDISPDTPEELDRAVADQAEFLAGCENNNKDLIEHMSTADVANDLDTIRQALGDEQLNYVGFSYGTSIGATYATMYPDHVRAMVLDGSTSPGANDVEQAVAQAKGFERTYQAFVSSCDASAECALSGQTSASVDSVRQRLDAAPLTVGNGSQSRELTRDLFDIGLASALYDDSSWGSLADAIANLDDGGAEVILELADRQLGRNEDGSWDNSWDAQTMVNCADSEDRPSIDEAIKSSDELVAASPTFGEAFRTGALACVDWPLAANPVPDWSAEGAPPILVVGTLGDPATPYEWSEEMVAALQGSVLLTYEGDGHTAFLRGGPCIDDAVSAYLIDLTLPAPGTELPGRGRRGLLRRSPRPGGGRAHQRRASTGGGGVRRRSAGAGVRPPGTGRAVARWRCRHPGRGGHQGRVGVRCQRWLSRIEPRR